jgi:hypothetical protein
MTTTENYFPFDDGTCPLTNEEIYQTLKHIKRLKLDFSASSSDIDDSKWDVSDQLASVTRMNVLQNQLHYIDYLPLPGHGSHTKVYNWCITPAGDEFMKIHPIDHHKPELRTTK